MRIHRLLYIALSLLMFASCALDNEADSGGNGSSDNKGVTATVSAKELDAVSRSTLYFDAAYGMQFKWDQGDELTILPSESNNTRAIYTLQNGSGTPNATFKGEGFTLSKGARYFAFNQKERDLPGKISIPDKANITVDYFGQRQLVNGTSDEATAHLGAYDFLVSTGVCSKDVEDQVHFTFQHLGLTMYIIMNNLPVGAKYKKLEIYDSKNIYRKPVRTINLGLGLNEETGAYSPAFNAEDVQSEEYKQSPRFSLFLGPDTNGNNDNSDDEGLTVGSDGQLQLFIELPPVDMTDNTFIFTLVPADNTTKPFFMKCEDPKYKKEYKAGKSYMMTGTAKQVTTYEVSLKVNHDWQLGNAVSRVTGDPGIEDEFAKPKYLYYVFCVDGKVKQVDGKLFNRVPAIPDSGSDTETIPETHWMTSSDKVFDTYYDTDNETINKNTFIFSVEDTEKDKTKNVYFVASMEKLDDVFRNIISSTTEAEIQSLLYDIPAQKTGTDAETAEAYQVRSQSFLKNLYSTPWEKQETFVGALKDPYQDVILYHVAAKVDLKWNSAAMLSGNVSVNNVKSAKLSLFKPTNNASAETENYTVTNAIDEETMYNGRQVFYLPQFNTYNVTVGGNVQDGSSVDHPLVAFTPATTNGWTSWLRWLANF